MLVAVGGQKRVRIGLEFKMLKRMMMMIGTDQSRASERAQEDIRATRCGNVRRAMSGQLIP